MSDREGTPTFSTWESYFYPETYDPGRDAGTLVNKLGERDAGVLEAMEYSRTEMRERQIRTGTVEIDRTFDAAHLRALHGHLFQDVYEWAGEYRTVNISKNVSGFAHVDEIDNYLEDAERLIAETNWPALDRTGFAMRSAEVFAHVNQAHPFREGNGRASKLFMSHVAELSNFKLVYDPQVSGITPEVWTQASMLSGPDIGSYEPVPDSLVPVFARLAQPSPQGPRTTFPPNQRSTTNALEATSRAASFPTPTKEATTQAGPNKLEEGTRYRPPSMRGQIQGYGSGAER